MSKFIEVVDMPAVVTIGNEYDATKYPKPGVYVRNGSGFFFTGVTVFFLGVIPEGLITEGPAEFGTAILGGQSNYGISENTLLKALAIAQNPALAEKLCL